MLSRWHGSPTSQMRSDTQQLEDCQFHSKRDVDQHRQLQELLELGNDHCCDLAIDENDQATDASENCDLAAATTPANLGFAQQPTDDLQDPSELPDEFDLGNNSNCNSRSDIGIDVDPAKYDESYSLSSSASVTSPVLARVPSTDEWHEPPHFSDPLQPVDNTNYSDCSDQHFEHTRNNGDYNDTPDNHHHTDQDHYTSDDASHFEGQHSVHDPGEDHYDNGGHDDTGDVHDDDDGGGVDLDPGDDYHDDYHDGDYQDDCHDDYYDDAGDFDYYDNDY
ncbi:hypothetical protein MJO28_009190 [Puccinia striiformis f. sp. tritici]|uniref:Uncharacterized protein n=1 Tax=Puccinia striiformis f. sp. tritici TaxID=168172 RepID=A0ACC0E7R0_9BASI|nr:hypothetical protein MJO28_009190 [Puccinia striiformis f. sp. tritici]